MNENDDFPKISYRRRSSEKKKRSQCGPREIRGRGHTYEVGVSGFHSRAEGADFTVGGGRGRGGTLQPTATFSKSNFLYPRHFEFHSPDLLHAVNFGSLKILIYFKPCCWIWVGHTLGGQYLIWANSQLFIMRAVHAEKCRL